MPRRAQFLHATMIVRARNGQVFSASWRYTIEDGGVANAVLSDAEIMPAFSLLAIEISADITTSRHWLPASECAPAGPRGDREACRIAAVATIP